MGLPISCRPRRERARRGGARETAQQRVPDESREGTDDPEVAPELAPGGFVGRRDPHLELDVTSAGAARKDSDGPRDLHEIRLRELRKGLLVGDVHKGNVESPDLADGANREFMRRLVHENLEPRLLGCRPQAVDPNGRGNAAGPAGHRSQPEERPDGQRVRQFATTEVFPHLPGRTPPRRRGRFP